MTIDFTVKEQKIICGGEKKPVADSKNYLYARFSFSADWDGCEKTALFEHARGETYGMRINGSECAVPWEVIKSPYFKLSVRGDDGDVLITTNQTNVAVTSSGLKCAQTPRPPTPDVYSSILSGLAEVKETAQNAASVAQSVRDDADSGLFGTGEDDFEEISEAEVKSMF